MKKENLNCNRQEESKVKEYALTAEGFPLQVHWADQFMNETERSIDLEEVQVVAQTVLFYAGILLELECSSVLPSAASTETPKTDWMLAPEEEVVYESIKLVSPAYHRVLHLSLYTISPSGISPLSQDEEIELRAHACPFIRSVRSRLHQLPNTWFQ
jgi:hypothetical protein